MVKKIYQDKKIKCQDCGAEFLFFIAEQKWYEERQFMTPKRCRDCRIKRKENERGDNNGSKKEKYRGDKTN